MAYAKSTIIFSPFQQGIRRALCKNMKTIVITESHRKITGSCTDCYLTWDDLREKGWKVNLPMYWEGRGRGFRAAIEMVEK